MTFAQVRARWDWRPIPGCPGRLKLPRCADPPSIIVGADCALERHESTAARHPVLIARLDSGGLISYDQGDGTFVHTLGDGAGFSRKLEQLGIADPLPGR